MQIKPTYKYSCLLFIVLSFSCKSSKTINSGNANLNLSAKELIKENTNKAANFKTLKARLKIGYAKGENSKTHTVDLRIEKDKVIWINSALGVIRAKITPDRVAFYNKWDNNYFDGDYAFLSDLLGTDLDFNKVQNLLLGETIYKLKEKDYKVSIHNDDYLLKPKKQLDLFEIIYLVDPSLFKIKSQQLQQAKEHRFLQIDYLLYQNISNQVLPENIKIIALESNDETKINLEFKSVSLNENLRFPFKIPSGYKEIELK